MRKILVTGFEPFGGLDTNASWEVVKRLPSGIGDFQVFTLQLPVVFGLAAETVMQEASAIQPDIILCIGQASGRSAITPEYVAINLRNASSPDNQGFEPHDVPVVTDGPDAYFAALPVRQMAAAILQSGISAEVSYSAGTYVCNDLMYGLLHRYKNTGILTGFIHLPLLKEQAVDGQPCVKLDDAVRAVTAAISIL